MKDGRWLAPRYTNKEIFEKDFSKMDMSALDVKCPGCKDAVPLNRKNNAGRSAGWCKRCNRAVDI